MVASVVADTESTQKYKQKPPQPQIDPIQITLSTPTPNPASSPDPDLKKQPVVQQPASSPVVIDHEAEAEYELGMSKMNASQVTDRDYYAAYVHLGKAAARNHTKAMEEIAIGLVFGDHLPRNLTEARRIFEHLSAAHGMPRSQFYLGFMHAIGLGLRTSNQAKALVHFTFGALGGDGMAQMAMGYRHWSGISVVSSCEMALSYYRKVNHRNFSGQFCV